MIHIMSVCFASLKTYGYFDILISFTAVVAKVPHYLCCV